MGLSPPCNAHTRSAKRLHCLIFWSQCVFSKTGPRTTSEKEFLRKDVPFWLFLVVHRIRGRPALLLRTIASVGLWLLGRVLPPDGCTPPNFFDFVFGDLSGRTSEAKEPPLFLLPFVHWSSKRLLVVAVWVIVLYSRIGRAVKADRWLGIGIE